MNILNKNNFIISKIIGTGGKLREGALLIRADRTVANDGKRLLEVINTRMPDSNHKDILISTSTSKEAMAMANKNDVSVTEKNSNEVVFEAVDSESGTKKSMQMEPLYGQYPKYEEAYPEGKPVFTIGLDSQLLAEMSSIISKIAHNDNSHAVKLEFYSSDKPMKLTAFNGTQTQKVQGIIMPLNMDNFPDQKKEGG